MAICPFAKQELIPPGSNDPAIRARVVIWHVAVSMAESLYRYFNGPSGGIESHFYINWRGRIIQYRDTAYEADANYRGNPFAISVETAGWAGGRWNRAQRRAMRRLALWLRDAENIPLQATPTWDGAGHGYHVQFGAPGPWTPVAKSCPGPERIKQFHDWFVPWMRSVSVEYTRGGNVDDALNSLTHTKGKGKRAAAIREARRALRSIRRWVKK